MEPSRATPTIITEPEYTFLSGVAGVIAVIGLVGGLILGLTLAGDDVIQSTYWTQLLTVSGISALPLIAVAVRLPRASGGTGWERPARISVFLAFPLVVGIIVLCLDRVAVTPKDGANPPDAFPIVTGIGIGLILAAIAIGVAADVLDKIDTEPKAE
jgi:hypothetical protein